MERWNLTDQEGARRRARRVLLRDQSPIQPAPVSRKKERWAKETRFPKNRDWWFFAVMFGRRINSSKTRAWSSSWREEEVPTTDGEGWNGGVGNLRQRGWVSFLPSPPSWGVGAQRRPREERRSCSPTDTTHRAPTSVRTLSSPHPTRPHTSSAGATFGTPLFFSFCHFQPAGEHGNRCFPCERGFFFGSGQSIMERYGLSDADVVFATPSPPEETGGGGRLPWGEGGWWRSRCPPPTAAGLPLDPPFPRAEPPPPLHLLTRRE